MDTLSFRFIDPDTHAGRVRAIASAEFPGPTNKEVLDDRFVRETQQSVAPITRTFTPTHDGLWTLTLQVWDVGEGTRREGIRPTGMVV